MTKLYKSAIPANRIAILCEGYLDFHYAKTATGVIRYRPNNVVCVIDSHSAGKNITELLNLPKPVTIVKNLDEAMAYNPDSLLIGIAPTGGILPNHWRSLILKAISNKLHIISGLHYFLNSDMEFSNAAKQHNVILWDVRKPNNEINVASMKAAQIQAHTILAVGTDCAVGKKSVMLEAYYEAQKRGLKSAFLATGQTGIIISGKGIPLDSIIGDFMAGAVEKMVLHEAENADYLWIEGQGSILHPGYSGVTLALMHGSCPEMMILCHQADRTLIDDNPALPIPSWQELIQLHETLLRPLRPSKIVAIAINTSALTESVAQNYLSNIEKETGLLATDPIRFGAKKILDAVLNHLQK